LSEEEINQIISYDTIETLTFNYLNQYHSSSIDSLRACDEMQTFPSNISKLTNLKSLYMLGFNNYKENDVSSIPKSVTKLSFGYKKIPQIAIDELANLPNIEELIIYDKDDEVEQLNLSPAKNIKKLVLTREDRSFIYYRKYFENSFLDSFDKLTSLTLVEYTFTQENIDRIAKMTNLEELKLISCGYDENVNLDSIKNLTKLQSLEINDTTDNCTDSASIFGGDKCPLSVVSKEIYSLTNLRKLVIYNQNNAYFNLIGNLKNIEYLDVSNNNIIEVPDSIANLTNLHTLILDENSELKTLPEAICKLKNLTKLSYDYTMISNHQFPSNIETTTTTTTTKKTTTKKSTTKTTKTTTKKSTTKSTKTTTKKTTTKKTKTTKKTTTTKKPTTKTTKTTKKTTKKSTTKNTKTKSSKTTKRTTKRTTTTKKNTTKRCGPRYGKCKKNYCCNEKGYCGTGSKYCKHGCQFKYGKCY